MRVKRGGDLSTQAQVQRSRFQVFTGTVTHRPASLLAYPPTYSSSVPAQQSKSIVYRSAGAGGGLGEPPASVPGIFWVCLSRDHPTFLLSQLRRPRSIFILTSSPSIVAASPHNILGSGKNTGTNVKTSASRRKDPRFQRMGPVPRDLGLPVNRARRSRAIPALIISRTLMTMPLFLFFSLERSFSNYMDSLWAIFLPPPSFFSAHIYTVYLLAFSLSKTVGSQYRFDWQASEAQ